MRYVIAESLDGLDAPDAMHGWDLARMVATHPATANFPTPGTGSVLAGTTETTAVQLWRGGKLVKLNPDEAHRVAIVDDVYRIYVDHINGQGVVDRAALWVRTSGQQWEHMRAARIAAREELLRAQRAVQAAQAADDKSRDDARDAGLTPGLDGIPD